MFQDLLAQLEALQYYYKTGHWQVKNNIFYSDHLLLDRLSSEAEERVDQVAEKAIGVTGDVTIVNLPEVLKKIFAHTKGLTFASPENSKYFEDALKLEQALISFCTQNEPTQTLGVKNMLADIADEAEGRVYLLKQRLSYKPPVTTI